jgi:Fic family protein
MLNTDTIHVTQELLALLSEIDEFKGAWRSLGTIAPERLNALRRVATIESIGSSTRIEGSKLTDREVERLLGSLEIKRFSTRDEQEVAGYAEVIKTVFRAWSDIPVTENYGGLNRSMQHWLEVYSPAFESPRSLAGVD